MLRVLSPHILLYSILLFTLIELIAQDLALAGYENNLKQTLLIITHLLVALVEEGLLVALGI